MNLPGLFGLLSLQALLMHPYFSTTYIPRLVRLALGSYVFWTSLLYPFKSISTPFRKDMSDNLATATASFYIAIKSLEWGLSAGPHYARTLKKFGKYYQWEKPSDSEKEAQRSSRPSFSELLRWTVWQTTSFRGFQFDWGPSVPCQRRSVTSLFTKFCVNKISALLAASLLVAARDAPEGRTAAALLNSLGIPNIFGGWILGELLYNLTFGAYIVSAMDGNFTLLILVNTLIYKILSPFPFLQPASDFFDPVHWPIFFDSPELSTSLANFWGRRWHQILRRIFKLGGQSCSRIAESLGFDTRFQKIAALFGPFFISGMLHEYIFWAALRPPHSTFRTVLGIFPGSMVFFTSQTIGILIEPLLIPLIPKRLGGGRLWTWFFLTVTVTFYRRHFVNNGWFDYSLPPLSQWDWTLLLKNI
ncbi:hypothetical protein O181_018738 [Austropuccinia psidii MF-1]|uniref:Wax synthase domain-containing protein n=1 Tax=Austropuccinia psidii MF-1 TaxID=1389203 RepID=A0A9Q3C9N0_9BASI|nr:hypothetical protein [Austropuccinia psidii MF-1]